MEFGRKAVQVKRKFGPSSWESTRCGVHVELRLKRCLFRVSYDVAWIVSYSEFGSLLILRGISILD